MSTTTYRFLKLSGQFSLFANASMLSNTLGIKVNTFVPRNKETTVTNLEVAINKPIILVSDCDACKKETVIESARIILSGVTSQSSVLELLAQLNSYVASDEFKTNWSGFTPNSGTVLTLEGAATAAASA